MTVCDHTSSNPTDLSLGVCSAANSRSLLHLKTGQLGDGVSGGKNRIIHLQSGVEKGYCRSTGCGDEERE